LSAGSTVQPTVLPITISVPASVTGQAATAARGDIRIRSTSTVRVRSTSAVRTPNRAVVVTR
jgi:hypothetical protein